MLELLGRGALQLDISGRRVTCFGEQKEELVALLAVAVPGREED